MYIFFIILILIASLLLVLTVLAQNPKSGMAANFGASNQVMGVRQTSDFLEKFTWGLALSIVVLSLAATMAMPSGSIANSKSAIERAIESSGSPTPTTGDGFMQSQTNPGEAAPAEGQPAPADQPAPEGQPAQ